jgi:hypothetical protein
VREATARPSRTLAVSPRTLIQGNLLFAGAVRLSVADAAVALLGGLDLLD